ncbi:MAG: hypothetical protein ABIT20_13460 [Gemmatimonadaceae bacterium]
MTAVAPRRLGIERRQILEHLSLFLGRQISSAHFVDVLRAAGIHEERAVGGEDVLDREVDLIGPAGDLADPRLHEGPWRGMLSCALTAL